MFYSGSESDKTKHPEYSDTTQVENSLNKTFVNESFRSTTSSTDQVCNNFVPLMILSYNMI